MELRDQFALAALQGFLAAPDCSVRFLTEKGDGDFKVGLAMECYEHADAMMKVREAK